MYVDDISIKLYRNVSSLYIMNFFCPRGQQNLVKIGQITKFQVIFVYFFNLDPFLPFSIPLEYFLNPYSESLYCFLKRTLQTTIHIGNSHIQQVPLAQSTACFQFKSIKTFKILLFEAYTSNNETHWKQPYAAGTFGVVNGLFSIQIHFYSQNNGSEKKRNNNVSNYKLYMYNHVLPLIHPRKNTVPFPLQGWLYDQKSFLVIYEKTYDF